MKDPKNREAKIQNFHPLYYLCYNCITIKRSSSNIIRQISYLSTFTMSKDKAEEEDGGQQQQQQQQQQLVPAAVLKFHNNGNNNNNNNNSNNDDAISTHVGEEYPIYLQEDWSSGIGGGLWSTGLAMAYYCTTQHFLHQLQRLQQQQQQNHHRSSSTLRVLELGSGNGFLSVCLVVATKVLMNDSNIHVIATDTAEHLSLMQSTVDLNSTCHAAAARIDVRPCISVQEYVWGAVTSTADDVAEFDLIIGSDLAYRDGLHDPLIDAFQQVCSRKTVILLGVTMTDTKPIFFTKLLDRGFRYEKLSDSLLEPTFRSNKQFGIFVIQKVQE
jgi:hypothetical protein